MAPNEQPEGGRDLATRIRRRRGALGLTREEAAARARMDPGYLAHIEHAPVAMTAGAVIRLADALDTTVSELLGSISAQPPGHGPAALHPTLDNLREQESLRLIEPGGIGRIAFETAGRLNVVPVNFTVHHGDIVFRIAATSAIGQYGEGPVAFEVDRIDQGMHEGWSVLISGTARQADAETVDVEPWAGGDRTLYILVTPDRITGRRIRACSDEGDGEDVRP